VDHPNLEFNLLRLEDSCRIRIPQQLFRRAPWIAGDQPVDSWLLVRGPGRCRLLSAAEADDDPDLQFLKARIAEEVKTPSTSALDFRDESAAILPLRLLPVQVRRHEGAWRLTLPPPVVVAMQLKAGESEIVALFVGEHIEFWNVETFKSAMSTPLGRIL